MIRLKSPFLVCAILLCLLFSSCIEWDKNETRPYEKPLEIVKLSEHNYMHISYIKTEDGAFIPCNGYIYLTGNEAVVFDTPLNDSISNQLIDFVQNELKASIKGVVVNHFHYDAAGGLGAFAKAGIPSYSSTLTAEKLKKDGIVITHPFEEIQEITLKEGSVENRYIGPAHSSDNIVSYMPEEHLLFGGCMIKSLGAGKGNVADANLEEWSKTVQEIKDTFPLVKTVIPGHGMQGDGALLDYTIGLFKIVEDETVDNLD